MSDEEKTEVVQLAPGLAAALAPVEKSTDTRGRRGPDPLAGLRMWSLEPDLEGWLGKEKS